MKDAKPIIIFLVIGLAVAFLFSGPLRTSDPNAPQVGTPLVQKKVYAEGTVRLSADLQKTADKYPYLFVMAKGLGQKAGAPIAVKRYAQVSYPFTFSLTQGDNMAGDEFYDGDISIVVWLDTDGVVASRSAEDKRAMVDLKKEASRQVDIFVK